LIHVQPSFFNWHKKEGHIELRPTMMIVWMVAVHVKKRDF
jgi:hypothetical protein